MADIVTLGDVSTKDTGSGSQLKTGGRRKYNMPAKCVDANPDPEKTWGKYIYEGGYYFEDFRATEPEQAVIDSMKKDIMSRGKKKTKKGN